MDKKKIIVIIISVIALIMSVFVISKTFSKKEEKTYNIPQGSTLVENKETLKEQKVADLLVSDVLLYAIDGTSKYTATVTNTSKKDTTATLYLTFYEPDNKTEVVALDNREIKANSKVKVDIEFEIDLTKITKIEYELR